MAIDYARMQREFPKQKAALTRAKSSGDPQKVLAACRSAVKVWDEIGAWPDAWHTWNIALHDAATADLRARGTTDIPPSLEHLR
jgi:hypothetical protein